MPRTLGSSSREVRTHPVHSVHASVLAGPIQRRFTTDVEPATRISIAESADVEPKRRGYHGTISHICNNLDGSGSSKLTLCATAPTHGREIDDPPFVTI